jgi:hypothetical protein
MMCMHVFFYLHTAFHIPSAGGSPATAIKLKEKFRMTPILLLYIIKENLI